MGATPSAAEARGVEVDTATLTAGPLPCNGVVNGNDMPPDNRAGGALAGGLCIPRGGRVWLPKQ